MPTLVFSDKFSSHFILYQFSWTEPPVHVTAENPELFLRFASHLLYKRSLQLKLSSTAKASNLLSYIDFLSKRLTVLSEAKFASPENMIQRVVTNSNSHGSPVAYSSEHWDGIVFFTAVTVNINSFQIIKRLTGIVMSFGGGSATTCCSLKLHLLVGLIICLYMYLLCFILSCVFSH